MLRRGKIVDLIAQSDVRIHWLNIPPGLYSATATTSLSSQHRKRTLEITCENLGHLCLGAG